MSSLRRLAEQLNLSHATVSAALRGLPTVKVATRERVLQAAEQIGYRANPLASALMGEMRRSKGGVFRGVVAILHLEAPEANRAARASHRATIAGAAERASELGFKTDEIVVGRDRYEWDRLTDILASRGVCGLFVLPPSDKSLLQRLNWASFPAVYAGPAEEGLAVHSVAPDHHGAVATALRRLHALGYACPGLALSADADPTTLAQQCAAYHAHFLVQNARLGATPLASAPRPFLFTDADDADSLHDWLQLGGHDAVITDAKRVEKWLERTGTRVPETHGLCRLGVLDEPEHPAGIDVQMRLVGRKGVELVTDQILRNERGLPPHPTTTLCPPRWLDGPTVKTLPGAAAAV